MVTSYYGEDGYERDLMLLLLERYKYIFHFLLRLLLVIMKVMNGSLSFFQEAQGNMFT